MHVVRFCVSLLVLACGPRVASIETDATASTSTSTSTSTSESSATEVPTTTEAPPSSSDETASALSSSSDESGTTGEQPLEPECSEEATCGNGIVENGEACDDANADDADGCSADCTRPGSTASAPIELIALGAAAVVDVDGSVLVAGTSPPRIVRLGPDGEELGSSPLDDPPDSFRATAILIGSEVIVVGSDNDSSNYTWRFDHELAPLSGPTIEEGRILASPRLASDQGLIAVMLTPESSVVERRGPDGTVIWSREPDPDNVIGAVHLAAPSDTSVFVAGGIAGLGDAAIIHVTPDSSTPLVFSPPEYPNAYFYNVEAMPDGGAVAVGDASTHPFVVRVDADGELLWTSTCSASDVSARALMVVDDRIVIGGSRSGKRLCNILACTRVLWVQHFGFDGELVATDTPDSLLVEGDHGSEVVAALGRHPDGSVVALGVETSTASMAFVSRAPW